MQHSIWVSNLGYRGSVFLAKLIVWCCHKEHGSKVVPGEPCSVGFCPFITNLPMAAEPKASHTISQPGVYFRPRKACIPSLWPQPSSGTPSCLGLRAVCLPCCFLSPAFEKRRLAIMTQESTQKAIAPSSSFSRNTPKNWKRKLPRFTRPNSGA